MEDLTPLYNKEFYLAYLCGEDVVLPIPDGNAERYLAYLCGMDVPIPDPLYTKEFYLAYKCGMDVELPEPGPYRIDQYMAKWCGMDVEVPEPMYRIEYWLAQLANSGELKTVSGNPISVSDALAKPAESLVIEILPQQSGSGDPSPDNVRPISGFTGVNVQRTGKNLLDKANGSVSDSNWWIGASGKATGADGSFVLPSGTYTFSASVTVNGLYAIDENNTNISVAYNNTKVSITLSETKAIKLMLYKSAFGSSDWTDVNIQLELGSTATAYEPYQGTTYSISWQDSAGTVYGGTLDVTTGVLTIDRAYGTLDGTENWGGSSSEWYTDKHNMLRMEDYTNTLKSDTLQTVARGAVSQADFHITGYGASSSYVGQNWVYVKLDSTFTTGQAVKEWFAEHPTHYVYPLATPQTIQLTPTEIEMLLGNNVIWNDVGGDMVLEYLADGPADDIDALQILLGNRYVNNGGADEATDREALDILLGGNTR